MGLSFQQIGEEASSNFSCFEFLLANGGVLRDKKQAVEHFPIKRKSFLLRYPLRLAHRQASYQTSRTTIDELPERHHLHEPYIALLLAVDCHSHWLLQSANTARGAATEGYPRFADSTGEGQY